MCGSHVAGPRPRARLCGYCRESYAELPTSTIGGRWFDAINRLELRARKLKHQGNGVMAWMMIRCANAAIKQEVKRIDDIPRQVASIIRGLSTPENA